MFTNAFVVELIGGPCDGEVRALERPVRELRIPMWSRLPLAMLHAPDEDCIPERTIRYGVYMARKPNDHYLYWEGN